MKNPRVTLADVAARAGMSAATASRALRGMSVHRKYRGKAEAAAAELGYVLNEAARSLRSDRTMTVGMVFHDLTSMLGMELLRALTSGLDAIGYSLFVSSAQGSSDHFDKLVHRFLQRRVDALVCVHGDGDGAALEGYASAGIPVLALITKRGGYARLPMISPSVDRAAEACVQRLRELGHRRILLLSPDRPIPVMDSVVSAARGVRLPVDRIVLPDTGFDPGAVLGGAGSKSQPTAVVALHADAVSIVSARGVKAPGHVSVVAIRDRSTAAAVPPVALSTIHLDPAPMGKLASDILQAWLTEGAPLRRDRKVEIGGWIERDSTGPARK